MGEIAHQYNYIGAAGSGYQSISDLTQHMNEWNEAWPQHRELHALLFTNSVWVLLRPTGLWTLKGCETGPTVYCWFSLTWSTAMFFNENKRKRLHNNRVKFPEDLVGAPTWPPFLCLGHQHGGRDVMWKPRIVLIREELKVLTICGCNYKGSTFSSVILRPWVLVRPESNSRPPAW